MNTELKDYKYYFSLDVMNDIIINHSSYKNKKNILNMIKDITLYYTDLNNDNMNELNEILKIYFNEMYEIKEIYDNVRGGNYKVFYTYTPYNP